MTDDREEYQRFEALSDLNLLAVNEFRKFVKENTALKPDWKQAVIQLLEQGIPQRLKTLQELAMGETDVETRTT